MKKRKKTTYDGAETKTVSKNEPLKIKSKCKTKQTTTKKKHKNQSTQVMHDLRTMKKRKKMTSYKEESESVFTSELRYRLTKLFYNLKANSKQSSNKGL